MGNKNSNKKEKYFLSYSNRDKYEGEIMNDLREGFGTYSYNNGDKYFGYWHENKKHGTGTFFFKDGNLYVGQWRNNEKDGLGTFYYKTGDKYIGEFKAGKKNGKGYFISNDGNKYVGFFEENKKNGPGLIYLKTGKKCRELWCNGLLIKFDQIEEKNDDVLEKNLNSLELANQHLYNLESQVKEIYQDNSFDNYIEDQVKACLNCEFKKKQTKHFTLEIAKYFKAKIPNNFFDTIEIITCTCELIFDKPDIIDWQNDDIVSWLSHLGLVKYTPQFKNLNVDGIQFLKCNAYDFKSKYEVKETKDLKILLKSIDFLRLFVKLRKDCQNFIYHNKEENDNKISDKLAIENNGIINANEENVKFNNSSVSQINIDKKAELDENDIIPYNIEGNEFSKTEINNNNNEILSNNPNFLLTKLSLSKMLLHSLNLSGFNFFINFEELRFIKKIGEGGFADVYLGLWNGKRVAIKKFLIKENQNLKHNLIKFIKEINIISSLRHPNIVLYMGATINKSDYYMISEYILKGSLFHFLHVQKGVLSKIVKFTLAYEIAIAVKYLHSRKIMHCDLKSSNILIDDNWKIKISDFGLSRIKNIFNLKENKGRIGTPHWMAPEIMKGLNYEEASDVFSYGMILWEMVKGEIPYYGMTSYQIIGIVSDCKKIVEIPKNCDPILKKIIKLCIAYEPKDRTTFDLIIETLEKSIKQLQNHDFISDEIYKFVC